MVFKLFFLIEILFFSAASEALSQSNVNPLSSEKMAKIYKADGLDSLLTEYYKTVQSMLPDLKSNDEKNKKENLKKLRSLIKATREITKKYDNGNNHYYSLSMAYKANPNLFIDALRKFRIKRKEKKEMLDTIKNNLRPKE